MARRAKGRMGKAFLWAVVSALIYHIWRARNEALGNQKLTKLQVSSNQIKEESKHRILDYMYKKQNFKDRS